MPGGFRTAIGHQESRDGAGEAAQVIAHVIFGGFLLVFLLAFEVFANHLLRDFRDAFWILSCKSLLIEATLAVKSLLKFLPVGLVGLLLNFLFVNDFRLTILSSRW